MMASSIEVYLRPFQSFC